MCMKKNLFLKFFVYALLVAFTFSACKDDNATSIDTNGELSQAQYEALVKSIQTKLNDSVNLAVSTLTSQLNESIAKLNVGDNSTALQNEIVQNAVSIDLLKSIQASANANLVKVAGAPVEPICDFSDLYLLADGDFTTIKVVKDVSWILSLSREYVDLVIPKKDILIRNWNTLFNDLHDCASGVNTLKTDLDALTVKTNTHISLITTLLGIVDGESTVLNGIQDKLDNLDEIKADKFTLNAKLYNLKDVYDELIEITDALDERVTQNEKDIADLQKRVTYIEEVELPKIWEELTVLYTFINNVYDVLDHRLVGLTFIPDYDFAGGLSSLIPVRGLSEWEAKTVEGGFGWQNKKTGVVNKGITWLKYNVNPSNSILNTDYKIVDLLYTSTTLLTRSTTDPLLEIVNEGDNVAYQENGVLYVPVRILQANSPLAETSFDINAKNSIKVALRVENLKEADVPDAPSRPEKPEEEVVGTPSSLRAAETRYVVSSEYVTVWLGLFDGRIAMKDVGKTDNIGEILPTEIITADFLNKNNTDYPTFEFTLQRNQNNSFNVKERVLAVFYDQFEKLFKLPADYLFSDLTLSFENVNLGNNVANYASLNGTTGVVGVTSQNVQNASGKTMAVLVKVSYNGKVYAVGYVRVQLVTPEKEQITITPNIVFNSAILNCSASNEFTSRNAVNTFLGNNVWNNNNVRSKTNVANQSTFYSKYTSIEIDEVTFAKTANSDIVPDLTSEELNALFAFSYTGTGNNRYIKGEVSNTAPFGKYTIVTILKSDDIIPDLKVTWEVTVKTPKLQAATGVWSNGAFVVNTSYYVGNMVANFSGILNDAFQKNGQGAFIYTDLIGTCITPDFVFASVPSGYTISEDGKTVLKNGAEAAVIQFVDGKFAISLVPGEAAHGLVSNYDLKVVAKGSVNDGTYTTFSPFSVIFYNPVVLSLPANNSFYNNSFTFNLYKISSRTGSNVIKTWDGLEDSFILDKEGARMLIDIYGINYEYDYTYYQGNNNLGSPVKLDLANITYTSNTGSGNLATLGATVTVGTFATTDVALYFNTFYTPLCYNLKFNANGATIASGMKVQIPVTVAHRWGTTTEYLVINVN